MRSRTNSLPLASALLPALLLCGGCEWFAQVMGGEGKYMLVGEDVVAAPGQQVCIEGRFRKAGLLWEPSPRGVYIFQDGNLYHVASTDANGTILAFFRPAAPGDYRFRMACYLRNRPGDKPLETEVLVACREPNTQFFVVDIDNTICEEPERRDVVLGEPNAMSDSVGVLDRLSKQYTVIYLTHRWDYLSKRTREWLARKGFPQGPIFASRGWSQVVGGNEQFKTAVLAGIRSHLAGPGFGIGDQASDVRAYVASGLRGILFIEMCDLNERSAVHDALKELEGLPDSAQVVCGWNEVEKAVSEGASFPPSAARARLDKRLKELEQGK